MTADTKKAAEQAKRLAGWAQFMYGIAALSAVGTVVAAIVLFTHKGQVCTPNPYNGVFGTDLQDCRATHPFAAAGAAAAVGGAIQVAVLGVVGYLCTVTAEMRRHSPAEGSRPSTAT